mgnify:CR=1 FL=1
MTRINQVMTGAIHYRYEDEDSAQALRVKLAQQIRRLPILSRTKQSVGIVSLGDLAVKGV